MIKRLHSILILLLLGSIVFSQNYQTINSGRISYFEDNSGYIHAIKVDSAIFDGDSIFYLMPNIRPVDEICHDIKADSWLGSHVVVLNNGDNLFFNKNFEEILIKTLALLDDEWIAFEIEDSLIIKANITDYDTLSFLGVNDSVKTISFSVYDELMVPIISELNDFEFLISKSYGFVKSMSFYHFPESSDNTNYWDYSISFCEMDLIGMDNPDLGIQNLTNLEVFDFQVGDEIHIDYESAVCGYSNQKKIIYKYLEKIVAGDYVYYEVQKIEFQQVFNGDYYEEYFTDEINQEIYTIDTSFDKLPDQAVYDEFVASTNYMTNINRPAKSNNLQYAGLVTGHGGCWNMSFFDGCAIQGNFIKGLGGPYYNCNYGTQIERRKLVYYNIGGEEWGIPLILTDIQQNPKHSGFRIYPNPVKEILHIEVVDSINETEPIFLAIYNSSGVLVYQNEMSITESSSEFKVKLPNSLTNGIYYLMVQSSEKKMYSTKIVISN